MNVGFQGLTAIVTGAGSGIGLAVAKKLHEEGANVFGLDLAPGEMGSLAMWIECDIGNSESVQGAIAKVIANSDAIDILINNAGVGATGSVLEATDEEWQKVLNINVVGTSRMMSACYPYLKQSKSASIVNTCSVVATVGVPNRAIYSASKGAVLSLTLASAADFVKDGIRVNCVNPGTADTPWVSRLLSAASDPILERAALEARQPMGRLVSAEEVASAIVYLAHPNQKSTTGTVLAVDGGMNGLRLPK